MSLTDRLRKGMVIRHQNHLYTVLDFTVAHSGKSKPTVHVKLRSLKGGHASDRTLDQLGRIEEVQAQVRPMQYLYQEGEHWVFMDPQTLEEHLLSADVLGKAVPFMVNGESYPVLSVDGQPLELQLPLTLTLEITDTAPVEHAGGSASVLKEATLASGLLIHVPLFLKTGDKVRVDTATRTYLGKEQ